MPYLSPPTLTREEQRALLEASAAHSRDHVIFSVAPGTGLRLGEIVGLNVYDVFFSDGRPKTRIRLRVDIAKGGRAADVFLPAALMTKLEVFWVYKFGLREGLDPTAPLFCSQGRRRISRRRVQVVFRVWQVIASFGRLHPFHALRHYAALRIMPSGLGTALVRCRATGQTGAKATPRFAHLTS